MPNNIVKDFAKQTGKNEKEIEKLWDKAKEITSDSFGKSEKDFKAKEWSYTTGTLKNMLGIKESTFIDFLNSESDLSTFLEGETQTSSAFSGTTPKNPIKVIDYSEEDEEEKVEEKLSDLGIFSMPYGKDLVNVFVKLVTKRSPEELKNAIEQGIEKAVSLSPLKDREGYISKIKSFFR